MNPQEPVNQDPASQNQTPEAQPEYQAQDQPGPAPQPIEPVVPPRPRSKLPLLVLAFLLVACGAGATYWFGIRKDKPATTALNNSVQTPIQTVPKKTVVDNVIYYNSDEDTGPPVVYSRAISGGDRKKILALDTKINNIYPSIFDSDSYKQSVVFITSQQIYLSKDNGVSFKSIYKLDPEKIKENQAITSIRFSSDGSRVVFGYLPSIVGGQQTTNTVKSINTEGEDVKDLHTFNSAGIYVYAYNVTTHRLVYSLGCYFCDGGPSAPHVMNIETGKDTTLVKFTDADVYHYGATTRDGKKLLFHYGVSDPLYVQEAGALGWSGGPPYKIIEVDVDTGKKTQLAELGKLHQKDTDGKYLLYNLSLGFSNDKNVPYYAMENKLYSLASTKPSLIFEADSGRITPYYVSADEIITAVTPKADSSDHTVYHYDVASKKAAAIYSGNALTQLMSLTTKKI